MSTLSNRFTCAAVHRKCKPYDINTLRPRQNFRHFPDDIFKYIFWSEHIWISIEISLKFVLKGLINYILPLVQMIWRRPGNKLLFEPMMFNDAHMGHPASMMCVCCIYSIYHHNSKTKELAYTALLLSFDFRLWGNICMSNSQIINHTT